MKKSGGGPACEITNRIGSKDDDDQTAETFKFHLLANYLNTADRQMVTMQKTSLLQVQEVR